MFGIYVLGNVSKGPSCKIIYAFSFSITPVGFSVFTEDKTICLILHYNDLLAYSQPNSRTGTQSTNFQLFFSLMQIFFYIVTNIRVHYFNLIYFLPIYIGSFENYGKHNSAIIQFLYNPSSKLNYLELLTAFITNCKVPRLSIAIFLLLSCSNLMLSSALIESEKYISFSIF